MKGEIGSFVVLAIAAGANLAINLSLKRRTNSASTLDHVPIVEPYASELDATWLTHWGLFIQVNAY